MDNSGKVRDGVVAILQKKTGWPVNKFTDESRLLQDIGLDGDDADEAIMEISQLFSVDISRFEFSQYFRSEPTLLVLFGVREKPSKTLTVGQLVEAAMRGYLL